MGQAVGKPVGFARVDDMAIQELEGAGIAVDLRRSEDDGVAIVVALEG